MEDEFVHDKLPGTLVVYLAGPVDDVDAGQAMGWRQQFAQLAPSALCICPPTVFLNARMDTAPGVRLVCHSLIASSSVVVANLLGPGLGLGTAREVEIAVRDVGVPVVAMLPEAQRNSYLFAFDCLVVSSVEEAAQAVASMLEQAGLTAG